MEHGTTDATTDKSKMPPAGLNRVIKIDEAQIEDHLGKIVRSTVEETLNGMLDAEVDRLCNAERYEHSPDRADTRAGHYKRRLHTKAGEVDLKMPKLRTLPFETQIIKRYQRRESSVEEALVEMYLAGDSALRADQGLRPWTPKTKCKRAKFKGLLQVHHDPEPEEAVAIAGHAPVAARRPAKPTNPAMIYAA